MQIAKYYSFTLSCLILTYPIVATRNTNRSMYLTLTKTARMHVPYVKLYDILK